MTQEKNLYIFMGITEDRYDRVITPFMEETTKKSRVADVALLAICHNTVLDTVEKAYCSYCIGRLCGLEEINNRSRGLLGKMGLIK
jgi:hypothetical protein